MSGAKHVNIRIETLAFLILEVYVILFLTGTQFTDLNAIMRVLFIGLLVATVLSLKLSKIPVTGYFIHMGIFMSVVVLSILWSNDKTRALESFSTMFGCSILGYCVSILCNEKSKIKKMFICYIIGCIVLDAYCMIKLGTSGLLELKENQIRLGAENTNINANTLGFTNAIGAVLVICNVGTSKKKQLFMLLLPLLGTLFLSASRSAVIVLIVGVLLYAILINQNRKFIRNTLYVIISLIVVYIALTMGWLDNVLSRFGEAASSISSFYYSGRDLTTGNIRLRLIYAGLKLFAQRPLLGYGSGQYNSLAEKMVGYAYSPHNAYIQSMVSYGIIGLIVWQGMYISILKKLLKNKKDNIGMVIVIIIIMWLVGDMFNNSLSDKMSYFILGLGFAYIQMNRIRRY